MSAARRIVRVGLIKTVPVKWDLRANWESFSTLASRAVDRGARLLCTPECFLDGYVAPEIEGMTSERLDSVAQGLDGGYVARAREFARRNAVHIVFGFTERTAGGCFNSAALIDDSGGLIGCYRKTHLLDHDTVYLPGDAFPVWDTGVGRIGIMICADRRWPETARSLKVQGVELIMNPTYGMWHCDNEWWMRTRSYENEVHICFTHPNVSLITDPLGGVAAKLQSNVPDVLVHDIDLDDAPDIMFPHRRADIYRLG